MEDKPMNLSLPAMLIAAVTAVLLYLIRTHRPRTLVELVILIVLVTPILTLSSAASYLEPVLRVILGGLVCRT
jgi:hypothetical protein